MAGTSNPPPTPPDDMHWGISYLREDIQDLRQDVRGLHNRIDALHSRLDSRFAGLLMAMITLCGIVVGANLAFLRLYLPPQ
jgi:hypothetical protein